MIRYCCLLFIALVLFGCKKDKEEGVITEEAPLAFTTQTYQKKTTLPCSEPCANVSIKVPEAEGPEIAADSINQKVFNTVRQIIFFGEKPYTASNYNDLMESFIGSYEELKSEFPQDVIGWEGRVEGFTDYHTDSVLNIRIHHYTFTGGAHGYEGDRSLLFNPKTGKALTLTEMFASPDAFKALAEKKFRERFNIPAGKPINSTGLMFEDEVFALPLNIFFKENGLLLLYNSYEISSYAEGRKELLIPYSELEGNLKIK